MSLTLKVPSIACEVCANTITKAIHNLDGEAEVNIDIDKKIVTVDSQTTVKEIKEAIIDAGHEIEE